MEPKRAAHEDKLRNIRAQSSRSRGRSTLRRKRSDQYPRCLPEGEPVLLLVESLLDELLETPKLGLLRRRLHLPLVEPPLARAPEPERILHAGRAEAADEAVGVGLPPAAPR